MVGVSKFGFVPDISWKLFKPHQIGRQKEPDKSRSQRKSLILSTLVFVGIFFWECFFLNSVQVSQAFTQPASSFFSFFFLSSRHDFLVFTE